MPRKWFNFKRSKGHAMFLTSFGLLGVGFGYAAVPLYRVFCAKTGYAGSVKDNVGEVRERLASIPTPDKPRMLNVHFMSSLNSNIEWEFLPCQKSVRVRVGEPALAFFKARNPTDKNITGVSTYNVLPVKSAAYFNKIQCFCFEEQRLLAGEEIEMPVLFFIDPAFAADKNMEDVNDIRLGYMFFKTEEDDEPLEPEDE